MYEGAPRAASALEFTRHATAISPISPLALTLTLVLTLSRHAIVINGFSKAYSMTGWRLGWVVAPDHLDSCIDALNQNMNVSAPTLSQRAGVAALGAEAKLELQAHVRKYQANREVVVAGLAAMGVQAHEYAPPQGAFYMYVDFSAHGVTDSLGMCGALLEEAGVAMTPGVDFEDEGSGLGERRVRISFPGSTEHVAEAMRRLQRWWQSEQGRRWHS